MQITGLEHAWCRREYFPLVECCNTVFELNRLENCDYFKYCNNNTRSNNPFKICMKSAKLKAFKHSFLVRIVREQFAPPPFGNYIYVNKFKSDLKKWIKIN